MRRTEDSNAGNAKLVEQGWRWIEDDSSRIYFTILESELQNNDENKEVGFAICPGGAGLAYTMAPPTFQHILEVIVVEVDSFIALP